MVCPKCKGENCTVQMVEVGKKTKNSGTTGIRKIGRAAMQVSTMGMYGLVVKPKQGSEKTKTKNEKRAFCQECGHDWKI